MRSKRLYPNCPKCPLTQTRTWLRRRSEWEIRRRYGKDAPEEWSVESCLRVYNIVSRRLSENGGQVSPLWDRRTALLARIVKHEDAMSEYWETVSAFEKKKAGR